MLYPRPIETNFNCRTSTKDRPRIFFGWLPVVMILSLGFMIPAASEGQEKKRLKSKHEETRRNKKAKH